MAKAALDPKLQAIADKHFGEEAEIARDIILLALRRAKLRARRFLKTYRKAGSRQHGRKHFKSTSAGRTGPKP